MQTHAGVGAAAALPRTPIDEAFSGAGSDIALRYDAVYGRARPAEGERRLLLAVLEEGIRTLMKHAHASRGRPAALRREALHWLRSETRTNVFDFESICEALGIDPGRLRERVMQQLGRGDRPAWI